MNKNHDKDGRFATGKSGKASGAKSSSSIKIPSTFQLDVSKMQKNKLPKELKKGSIDSPAYKKWIYENWAKK